MQSAVNKHITPPHTANSTPKQHKRESRFELLRIVSMLLVLLIHFAESIPTNATTLYRSPLSSVTAIFLHSLSIVCVNCFILISGYWGIKCKSRSILSLLYQVLFWLIIGTLIANALNIGHSASLWHTIIYFFSQRWFVPAYLGLYVLSPALNAFAQNSSNKDLGKYLIYFYAFSTIVGYLLISNEFNQGMSVISLIGLYLLGAYLRQSNLRYFTFKARTDLVIYLMLAAGLTILQVALFLNNINISPLGYLNPIVIIMSIYLFLFFQKLNIGEVKFINYIAASAFAVYLFHFHPALYGTYIELFHLISNSGFIAPIILILSFIAIFIIAVIIDRVRIQSWNLLCHFQSRIRIKTI